MSDLDLEIDHYEISDLETFFRLQSPYNEQDIAKKETEIRTLLLSSGHIGAHFKRDLIVFLEEGKKRLIAHKIKVKTPTTIYVPKDGPKVPHSFPNSFLEAATCIHPCGHFLRMQRIGPASRPTAFLACPLPDYRRWASNSRL